MKLNFFVILISLLIVSGCGPVYKTTYTYIKPKTPEGVSCTFQCENSRLRCAQNQELKRRNCEANNRIARLEYEQCVSKKGKNKCYEDWDFCEEDTSTCDELYRQCYTFCGGEIVVKTVCVEDCE